MLSYFSLVLFDIVIEEDKIMIEDKKIEKYDHETMYNQFYDQAGYSLTACKGLSLVARVTKEVGEFAYAVKSAVPLNDFEELLSGDSGEALFDKVAEYGVYYSKSLLSSQAIGILDDMSPHEFSSISEIENYMIFLDRLELDGIFDDNGLKKIESKRNVCRNEISKKYHNKTSENFNKISAQMQQTKECLQNSIGNIAEKIEDNKILMAEYKKEIISCQQLSTEQIKISVTKNSEKLDTLKDLLLEQGIVLDSNMQNILAVNEKNLDISIISAKLLIENEQRRINNEQIKIKQAEQEKIKQDYQSARNGFNFLSSLGDFTGSKNLSKLGKVGASIVDIKESIGSIKSLVDNGGSLISMSAINPYVAIAMGAMKIVSCFMKKGPGAQELIFRQLQEISEQINDLHKDMHKHFREVNLFLASIEQLITRNMQQLKHLIINPVNRKLENIQYDINMLAEYSHSRFNALWLKDLVKYSNQAHSIVDGIIPNQVISQYQISKLLTSLAVWIKKHSYNELFNGVFVCNLSESGFRPQMNYQQISEILEKAIKTDPRTMINVPFLFTNSNAFTKHFAAPNTAIQKYALKFYLALRLYAKKLNINYDPKNVEQNAMLARIDHHILLLNSINESKPMILNIGKNIIKLFEQIKVQYAQLKLIKEKNLNLAIDNNEQQYKLAGLKSAEEVLEQILKLQTETIPVNYKFEYAKGGDSKRSKGRGRQREFKSEYGLNEEGALLIVSQACIEKYDRPLFDKIFILAQKMGLIEINCKMHRTMKGKFKQHKPFKSKYGVQEYVSEGEFYGLEVNIFLLDSRKTINICAPTKGYANWLASSKRTTHHTIESHIRALPEKTIANIANIEQAASLIHDLVIKKIIEIKDNLYKVVAAKLLDPNSALNALRMQLNILKLHNIDSNYVLKFAGKLFDSQCCDDFLEKIHEIFSFCKKIELQDNNQLFSDFDKLIDQFTAEAKHLNIENLTIIDNQFKAAKISSLHDLYQMKFMLDNYHNVYYPAEIISDKFADFVNRKLSNIKPTNQAANSLTNSFDQFAISNHNNNDNQHNANDRQNTNNNNLKK